MSGFKMNSIRPPWLSSSFNSTLENVINNGNSALKDVLENEMVLQELKGQEKTLIDYLLRPNILEEMVDLITLEPSLELDEKERYKLSNIACEVLTADLMELNEKLSNESLLNKMYIFLDREAPLNPLLSSFVSRTISTLISKKNAQNWDKSYEYTCFQTVSFFESKSGFINLLLRHMGTSAIMDLTNNLLTQIEGPRMKQYMITWLVNDNDIISRLIHLLATDDSESLENVAILFCNILRKFRDDFAFSKEINPILAKLESHEISQCILASMFQGDGIRSESVEAGLIMIMELLQPLIPMEPECGKQLNFTVHKASVMEFAIKTVPNGCSELDSDVEMAKKTLLENTLTSVEPYLHKLREILVGSTNISSDVPVNMPFGKLRLLTTKFIVAIVSANNAYINKKLVQDGILKILLELFLAYPQNNFMHDDVEKVVLFAIDNAQEEMEANIIAHLIKDCHLLHIISRSWDENELKKPKRSQYVDCLPFLMRMGMAVYLESNRSVSVEEMGDSNSELENNGIKKCLAQLEPEELENWRIFVEQRGKMKELFDLYNSPFGGYPSTNREHLLSEGDMDTDDNNYFEDLEFGNDEWHSSEGNGFGIEGDTDTASSSADLFGRLNGDKKDENTKEALFSAICSQKWQSYNNGLNILDSDEEEENRKISSSSEEDDNGDEEEEDEAMDVDTDLKSPVKTNIDPWAKLGAVNPWESAPASSETRNESGTGTEDNWADFGTFQKAEWGNSQECVWSSSSAGYVTGVEGEAEIEGDDEEQAPTTYYQHEYVFHWQDSFGEESFEAANSSDDAIISPVKVKEKESKMSPHKEVGGINDGDKSARNGEELMIENMVKLPVGSVSEEILNGMESQLDKGNGKSIDSCDVICGPVGKFESEKEGIVEVEASKESA